MQNLSFVVIDANRVTFAAFAREADARDYAKATAKQFDTRLRVVTLRNATGIVGLKALDGAQYTRHAV